MRKLEPNKKGLVLKRQTKMKSMTNLWDEESSALVYMILL